MPDHGFLQGHRWVANCALLAGVALLEANAIAWYTCEHLPPVVLSAAACAVRLVRAAHAESAAIGEFLARPPAPVDPPPHVPDDLRMALQRVGPTTFRVDRSAFLGVLERLNSPGEPSVDPYFLSNRIVPDIERGKVAGVRLLGVRRGSPFDLLGVENGDRIEAINGLPIADPESALAVYTRLRTAHHLTVAIRRRGRDIRLDYELR